MRSSNFGRHYRLKKKLNSYQLSLLTPYIDLQPTVGNQTDKEYIKKSVKSVTIKQDSDVIVFNKIIALVLFVPDDVGFTSKTVPKTDKFNFMDGTNQIFNLGSIWVLKCGWTGDKRSDSRIRKVLTDRPFSDLTTHRTLLKMNINLIQNKYVGTLLFCRRSFLHFRDAVIPFDSIIQGKITANNKLLNVVLSLKDWLLDRGLLNQFNTARRLSNVMDLAKKTYLLRMKNIVKLQKLLVAVLDNDLYFLERNASKDTPLQVQANLNRKQKLLLLLSGKKYCTVRYLLTQMYQLLFGLLYAEYIIYLNGIGITKLMQRAKDASRHMGQIPLLLIKDAKYFIPAVILSFTHQSKLYHNQILHLRIGATAVGNIRYLKDYKLSSDTSAVNKLNRYVFNDRADTLLDLYSFNKKVYRTNFLLRLSNINDYLMLGFPKIKIYYLSPQTVVNRNKENIFPLSNTGGSLVITVTWSFPVSVDDSITLVYDRPNLLYTNFALLAPTNDQMLKINEFNILQSTRLGRQLAMRGVIKSVKKILVPGKMDDVLYKKSGLTDIHTKFKHRMYRLAVKRVNGGALFLLKDRYNNALASNRRVAGRLESLMSSGIGATLYYFTSNLTYQRVALLTKLPGRSGDLKSSILSHLRSNGAEDISGKLISYLSNSLNISVDIHGLFNVPVFRGYIVTLKFPGPISPYDKKRWLNGRYVITSQLTKVDRTTIVTTLKGKRLPATI